MNQQNKTERWVEELDEISLMIEWEKSKKLQSRFVVPQDYIIFKYKSATPQLLSDARREERQKALQESLKVFDKMIKLVNDIHDKALTTAEESIKNLKDND